MLRSPDDPIEVVLADDHAMVRRGLRMVLDAEPDLHVVAEAADVDSAWHRALEHHPRVVVLDLNMPGEPTLPAIPRFLEAGPALAVVVLTMENDPGFAREALAAGASAYVLKSGVERELVEAVRAAAEGRTYLDPALGARLAAHGGAAADEELRFGATFAGHRIDGVAGRGAMGVVYRATDLVLERRVALKLIASELSRDHVFRARFERECKLAAALEHPHVVQVFHAGDEHGRLYVTMRYVEGSDLRELLARERRLAPARATRLVAQVAGALDEAHQRGLVHRDVKPANILIGRRDGEEQAFLTDFGVTRVTAAPDDLTATGVAVGTADYMAPEQAQGRAVDGRADVYALACVLFRTIAGSVVFDRDSDVDKLWAHIHEPPPPLLSVCPDLPPALGDALARGLAKDPADRYATAGELARAALAAVAA